MSEPNKRKTPPGSVPNAKKKKGGNNGKWSTPHQKVKTLQIERGSVEPGEVGIWVTCARSMEGRAAREMMELFDKYAKIMYGIPIPGEENDETDADGGGADEIEDLVQKEIASLKAPPKSENPHFTRIRLNVECLLFSKTRPPIDPVAMAHQISVDIKKKAEAAALVTEDAIESGAAAPVTREFRYLNRLTPITASGRANEKGVREVARKVLSPWFKLAPQTAATSGGETGEQGDPASSGAVPDETPDGNEDPGGEKPACTFAIRPSFRHHHELERRQVIDLVAELVDQERHKVDLETPDKVILIDIFRYTCGMSVVDGDWNDLRKYNLSELNNLQFKSNKDQTLGEGATATADKESKVDTETGVAEVQDGEK
ncbi:hypothetical protein SCUCBS95973_000315 [Sporothrix curviconia]|uniref:THUMP domain-containing protein n=1 Tax=Sporothrix curviconia TaxID=1260050 RepID=A0ABP0AP57_9PEZI